MKFCTNLPDYIALSLTQQNWKRLHIRQGQYTEFHISNFWSRQSVERKRRFLVLWDLKFKEILTMKPPKPTSTQSEF